MSQIVKLLLEEQALALFKSELSLPQPGQYYLDVLEMLFSRLAEDDNIILVSQCRLQSI